MLLLLAPGAPGAPSAAGGATAAPGVSRGAAVLLVGSWCGWWCCCCYFWCCPPLSAAGWCCWCCWCLHLAVCTNDRRRGLGQVQNRYGCGATKMYLSRLFAKKPMKASHRRSKTTVSERAFLHAVDLCSTVSRKTESKPIWFPDMSKTRQPAYPRNIIFKKTKCACAMQEIETSNGNHSIRQRLPSRKTA